MLSASDCICHMPGSSILGRRVKSRCRSGEIAVTSEYRNLMDSQGFAEATLAYRIFLQRAGSHHEFSNFAHSLSGHRSNTENMFRNMM